MELLSNENVNIFDLRRRKKLIVDEINSSNINKTNYETSINLKSDSFILNNNNNNSNNNKKSLRKTKNKLQEKTKELLSFDSNNNNNTININTNNSDNLSKNPNSLNKKKSFFLEQDIENINNEVYLGSIQIDSSNKKFVKKYHSSSTIDQLPSILAQKMIVNNLQAGQNLKTNKTKKNKKSKKKKVQISTNPSEQQTELNEACESDKRDELKIEYLKFNESIRWENELENDKQEAERIELYKINRRKRYIEQKNSLLKGKLKNDIIFDFSLSSPSTCSSEHLKNFKNNLENIKEMEKSKNYMKEKLETSVQDKQKCSSACSIKKREKESDSAISSISSNSPMFY